MARGRRDRHFSRVWVAVAKPPEDRDRKDYTPWNCSPSVFRCTCLCFFGCFICPLRSASACFQRSVFRS